MLTGRFEQHDFLPSNGRRASTHTVKSIHCSLAQVPDEATKVAPYVGWRTERPDEQPDDAIPLQGSITRRRSAMLYTIAVVLVILWAVGLVSSYTMGGFIHVLLVIAIVVVLLRLISGRNPL